jgi:hypothetical protein
MGRGTKKDVPKSMCLLSMLYDPVNYLNLDVQMGETDGSELQLLLKHLPKIDKGDIVMLDRGCPSRYLFSILVSKGSHFIVRMKPNWVPVKEFVKSRKKDITITMEVPDGEKERYRQQFPSMRKTMKCRMIKVLAENGKNRFYERRCWTMIRRPLAVFDKQVQSNTEIVRHGRSSPRKKKPPRLYHMNYKDL